MKNIKPRWIVIGVIVLALVAGVIRAMSNKRAQQVAASAPASAVTQVELTNTDVLKAELRDITQGLAVSGTVKAVNYAVIKARVAGELKEVLAREGDAVKAGDVLARIDPTEYQRRWQQATETASAAKSQMEIAQRQWDINKSLVDRGFISKIAMDNSDASYQGAVASHKAAIAGADVARKALDDATLRAPFAGIVSGRAAQVGERVGVDAKIMELVDLNQLEVEVPLSPSESMDVRVGQVAALQVEDRKDTIGAKVKRISPSAQTGSRSVLIYLALDKAEGLRHGLFAKGILGMGKSQVMAVPLSAVRTDRAQPYVQVVEQVGGQLQVMHKTVTLGVRGMDLAQPESETMVGVTGLTEGSTVLKSHVGALREGMAVKYTAAASAPIASASNAN
ncbi:efflux transporter periplasmic adaptor subunit [Limnohabitans sp. TS-CS-82]|uniref:efflux RND transporter periplasmic adaptor subunit n=1 Tax=Limnohabitans sp. TS-CS-82 TaxID=2094193 RepID=UPI000CF2DC65|nr:efflux RND transporter periplasmic adaptor subunit [Limnohabitans sp. TS-CS-82]PQA82250.1 efflux transporter periplasmic adaptor subunit [Limnohabitans sp. TS-CS-82]